MIPTPYYLIDEAALLRNLHIIDHVRRHSGAKVLLALKCFASWSVFELMRQYMDGTTSSSLFEARLGHEKFGGETHAYSVAYSNQDIAEVSRYADKVIFNSISQLERHGGAVAHKPLGLRLNPGISSASYILADPARPHSRLGERDPARIEAVMDRVSGFMVHNHCENNDFGRFDQVLSEVEARYGHLFQQASWISLGGGIHFTGKDYPLDRFCARLRAFAERWGVQVYLEPGQAAVDHAATLEVTVQDVVHNGKALAIVDSSAEAHMLDLLMYGETASIAPDTGPHAYMICGNSCLAGDIFGEFRFEQPLRPGDRISLGDAAAYTLVKKNWFNGVRMPSIAVRRQDGRTELMREFSYRDYVSSLS